ncbi:SDK-like protein [Mya arenaria]|uniref:SDK-like protein n=1 Tax=Mya arenaria TaxID=6604 RepID=A0ABY7DJ06_MYAAR|nr:SDK-like protein [Mya arenaria]
MKEIFRDLKRTPDWLDHVWAVSTILLVMVSQADFQSTDQTLYPPTRFYETPDGGMLGTLWGVKTLTCRSSSNPAAEIRWLKNDQYFTNASKSLYQLRLKNITRLDEGEYRCEASNSLGALLSSSANFGKFSDGNQTFSISVPSGDPVIIPMPYIESNPPMPSITWFKNGELMNTDSERHQITLNGSLILLDCGTQDSNSLYHVKALNGMNSVEESGPSYRVTVTESGITTLSVALVFGPENKTAIQDKDTSVSFECVFNARPASDLVINWYRITNESKQAVIGGNDYLFTQITRRILTISSPRLEHSGQYQCEAKKSSDTIPVVASAFLTVYESPTFGNTLFPQEINRDFGQTVTMHCTAQGVPTPEKVWYFNALQLGKDFNSSSFTLHPNGSLTVEKLDMDHAGVYQCFLRNIAGETSKATWLKVNSSPPEMIIPPQNLTIIERSEALLMCSTRGAPKPSVTWTKTTSLGVSESAQGLILDNGNLLIGSAASSHSGMYTCNATNMKTTIDRPPQSGQFIKSSTADFLCGVSKDPSIEVTWQWVFQGRFGASDQIITSDSRRNIDPEGKLTISGVRPDDIGSYTCNVFSAGGNDSKTVSLEVIELPYSPVITMVTLDSRDVRAVVVTFTPDYDGNTPITKFSIQYKEVRDPPDAGDNTDTWITSITTISWEVRQATVSGLQPARKYQFRVFASNKVGEGPPSQPAPEPPIEMPQQPPSEAPIGFYGRSTSNESITLFWQPPNVDSLNGILLGYAIRYKPTGYLWETSSQKRNVTQLPTGNPYYELTNLAYFTPYDIQIAAYNIKGIGVYSGTITNSTAIHVTWTPPNSQNLNGRNLGYKVVYKVKDSADLPMTLTVPHNVSNPIGTQMVYLTNLHKFTEYVISVLCFTGGGDGPVTVPLPSQVGSLTVSDIADNSMTIHWTQPTEVNGLLQGYTLMYEKKDNTISRMTIQLDSSDTLYRITNLTAETMYTIYLYASTRKGPGPTRSADVKSGVEPEKPWAPSGLGVSNIEARSVLLQFWLGFDGRTSITLWIVEAQEGPDTDQYKVIAEIHDPNAPSLKVTNLKPYTYYRLRMVAENIAGRSPPSEPTRLFQTLQAEPGVSPGNLTVRALNATALRVSWTPLKNSDWNGEGKGYKIFYRRKASLTDDWLVMTLDMSVNMNSAILVNLEEWVEYEVKILAYNDIGESIFSRVVVERTRESVPGSGPQLVNATAASATSINVTWGEVPTLQQNGMILGYKVNYRSSEANIVASYLDVPGNTTNSTTVDNLLPGPPRVIWFPYVSYTNATIEWEEPSEPNGIIQNYKVLWRVAGSDDPFENRTVGAGERKQTMVNLQTQAYYEFQVTGRTQKGWGETATVEVFTMSDRITISWKPANFNGYGPIRNFTVQYQSQPNGLWTSVEGTILHTMTTYTVKMLKPNTRYVFQVAATNDEGRIPEGAPRYVKVERLTTTSVKVSWEQPLPSTWNGQLEGYFLLYRQVENTNYQELEIDDLNTIEVTLSDLQKFVNYEFLLKAFNKVGRGPPSTPVVVFVGEAAPSAAPVSVTAVAINPTEIEIAYWLNSSSSDTAKRQAVQASEDSLVIKDLAMYSDYGITVRALNLAGEGPHSPPVHTKTSEGLPGKPGSLSFWNITFTSLDVVWEPPVKPNGKIANYELAYTEMNAVGRQVRFNVSGTLTSLTIKDLLEEVEYHFTIVARTSVGSGEGIDKKVVLTSPQGAPAKPTDLTYQINNNDLILSWLDPAKGDFDIYGHTILANSSETSEWTIVSQLLGNVTRATINLLQFNPDRQYQVRVVALNKRGRSPYSDPSEIFNTPAAPKAVSSAKAFHYQPWFPVIVALAGGIVILVVISLLCLISHRNKSRKALEQRKPGHMTSTSNLAPSTEPEEGGFSGLEMTRQSTHSRRQKFAGIRPNGSVNNIYSRSPPRPSPASVAYNSNSDDDTASAAKPPLPDDDDDDDSSVTEKPSVADSDSEASDEASDDDSLSFPPPPSSSPPPPPFSAVGATGYAPPTSITRNIYGAAPVTPAPISSNWQSPNPSANANSSFNAYQYTDSEAESSHYAFSLNGGQIIMNNTAGSRAPMPGFSSFVCMKSARVSHLMQLFFLHKKSCHQCMVIVIKSLVEDHSKTSRKKD